MKYDMFDVEIMETMRKSTDEKKKAKSDHLEKL